MHTQITPLIRVSTAAIWYDGVGWQRRFQYETWCFSDEYWAGFMLEISKNK